MQRFVQLHCIQPLVNKQPGVLLKQQPPHDEGHSPGPSLALNLIWWHYREYKASRSLSCVQVHNCNVNLGWGPTFDQSCDSPASTAGVNVKTPKQEERCGSATYFAEPSTPLSQTNTACLWSLVHCQWCIFHEGIHLLPFILWHFGAAVWQSFRSHYHLSPNYRKRDSLNAQFMELLQPPRR